MRTNFLKLKYVGYLLLSLLCCLLGATGLTKYQQNVDCFKSRPSLHGFILFMDRNEQTILIEQAQQFASNNGFQFDIAYFSRTGENFRIDMTRKDVELVIWNTVVDLDRFDVHFYNNDCTHPTTAEDIQNLASDLKSRIIEIPSAKITEEK